MGLLSGVVSPILGSNGQPGLLGNLLGSGGGSNGILGSVLSIPSQILGAGTSALGGGLEEILLPLVLVLIGIDVLSKML